MLADTAAWDNALAEALGRVIADMRRDWQREHDAFQAEARATLAELRASMADVRDDLRQRIAAVQDGERGPQGEPGPMGLSGMDGRDGESGPPGRDGEDGRSPFMRGLYAVTESYQALDIVALDGGAFIACRDDPGPCPGDGWRLLVSRGKRGEKGERGPSGPSGPQGKQGESIVDVTLEGSALVITTTAKTVAVDLTPLADLWLR